MMLRFGPRSAAVRMSRRRPTCRGGQDWLMFVEGEGRERSTIKQHASTATIFFRASAARGSPA